MKEGLDVNHVWPGQLKLLHIAASRGDLRSVDLLLLGGAEIDSITGRGETALHLASAEGHKLIVQALRRVKADPSLSNHRGDTPLHVAMVNKHFDCVRQLLWLGAPTDARNLHGLRAEDMVPTLDQPDDLVELFRATRLRERRASQAASQS